MVKVMMKYKRIEELRKSHKESQAQIAYRLGVQREVYRRYETGIREIPVQHLITLAKYYDVSIDYIVELIDGGQGD